MDYGQHTPYTRVQHSTFSYNVLMHWYTCKYLLNTLGRAVEQFVVYLDKQAKVSSRGRSTSHVKSTQSIKMCYDEMM